MKRATFATEQFPWEEIAPDDYVCAVGRARLNAGRVRGGWWWRVVISDPFVVSGQNNFCKSKHQAIGRCEGFYWGQLAKSDKNT